MSESIPSRMKTWLVNCALGGASLVAALLLVEVTLRLVGFSDPLLWSYDDVTGSKLRAGAQGWQRREGEAFITINKDGLRDRDHNRTKPRNTVRIAILGASMAEAIQDPLETTFWSVLERDLKKCGVFGNRDVETINFGVAGYGTAQELLTYRHRASAYSPDITILAMTPAHDVRNNSKELEPTKLSPFFTIRNGKLELDNGFLNDPEYISFKSGFERKEVLFDLRTFQFVRRLKAVAQQWQDRQAGTAPGAVPDLGQNAAGLIPATTSAWLSAWEVTERLIAAIRDEVVAGGGRFVLVSIPIGIQVHPDPELRNRFAQGLHIEDLWYPEQRIRDLADRETIEAITLGRTYQQYAQQNRVYLHGFKNTQFGSGHLNENGHRLIGEALAKYLCRESTSPSSGPSASTKP